METSKIIDTVLRNVAFKDDENRDNFINSANEFFNKLNGDICWEHSIFGAFDYEKCVSDSEKQNPLYIDSAERLKEATAYSMEQAKAECKRVINIITSATEDKEKQQCLFLFYVLFRSYNSYLFLSSDEEDEDSEIQVDLALYDGVKRIVRESWRKVTISFNTRVNIDSWTLNNFDSNSISVSIKTKNKQTYIFNSYEKFALLSTLQMSSGELVSDWKLLASVGGSKTYIDSGASAVKEWWLSKTLMGRADQSWVNKYGNMRNGDKRNSTINRYYKDILFPIHKYIKDTITMPYTKIPTDLIFNLFKLNPNEFEVLASNQYAMTKGKKADTQIIIDSYEDFTV